MTVWLVNKKDLMIESVDDKPENEKRLSFGSEESAQEYCLAMTQERKLIKKQHNRKYYEKHRERLIKQMTERIPCPHCEMAITKCNMKRHTNVYCKKNPQNNNI